MNSIAKLGREIIHFCQNFDIENLLTILQDV